MEKRKMEDLTTALRSINWDFSDFSSSKYPLDLNSIPWYPATFISPIPRLLVASLSNEGDTVLDPFGGKGTTAIETTLQNRIPIYCDLNPYITESTEGLFAAIEYSLFQDDSLDKEEEQIASFMPTSDTLKLYMDKYNVSPDAAAWYHKNTLCMLVAIVTSIHESIKKGDLRSGLIKKLAFTSILKSASSQKGHFTYVTDNCKPKKNELIERNATSLYLEKIKQILCAADEFVFQYSLVYKKEELPDLLSKRNIVTGDAKNLDWIEDNSVDLVVTSPPYLCSQDYIKTMRLINLFFENKQAFSVDVKKEIGARATRNGKSDLVVNKFYKDMSCVFKNISRVLKQDGYFALVIGQGKSKITSEYNIIEDLVVILKNEFNYNLIFQTKRHIGNRVIRIGGVDEESVLIFKR